MSLAQNSLNRVIKTASGFGLGLGVVLAGTTAAIAIESPANAPKSMQLAQAETEDDIVEVAVGADDFDTLVAAVEAAGLVETLQGEGPFTVFAPTDDAFAELPDGVLDALLLPENEDLLVDILTYHVVPGEVTSGDLEDGVLDSLNGGLAVDVSPERAVINNASVVMADIEAENGIIHAINRVLIPVGVVDELTARMEVEEEMDADMDAEPIRALW